MLRGLNKRIFCFCLFFFGNMLLIYLFTDWKESSTNENFSKSVEQLKIVVDHTDLKPKRKMKIERMKPARRFQLSKSLQQRKRESHQRDMQRLHEKVYYHTTDQEVEDFFKEAKLSNERFKNTVDMNRDSKLLKSLFTNENKFHNRLIDQLNLKLNFNSTKRILIWSDENSGWAEDFDEKNCNINNCIFTEDRSLFNDSHAVVFTELIITKKIPKFSDSQIKIFYRIESPFNSNFLVDNNAFKMNWSATYRRDSIIPTPYEYFTPYLNTSNLPKTPINNFSDGKFKLVAWFASNCYTQNGRMNYVLKLKEYIDIDIYGNCGDLHCERGRTECENLLKKEYKFYLAFENSNCKDYVTEKLFWNALRNNVVPVVMGAHVDEYKRIAPPRSFIHVDMFTSPKQLAEYLLFLNEHDNLYNSYFLWKHVGEFIDTKFVCRLCGMVNLAPHFPTWYDNANEWWGASCDRVLNLDGYSSWKKI